MPRKDEQYGGRYVGRGATACVFKPHLRCNNMTNLKNAVGKVFSVREQYEDERDITREIMTLDPRREFTLPILATCDDGIRSFRQSDEIQKCESMTPQRLPNTYHQIIYPYGGKSLQDIMTSRKGTINSFFRFFFALESILKGLVKFNKKGIVHMDVKPPNLMYLKGRMYLIDFGLLFKSNQIYNQDIQQILVDDYLWFPPEFKAYLLPARGSFDVFQKRYMDNFSKNDPLVGQALSKVLGINVQGDLQRFHAEKVAKKTYGTFALQTDVYALGIVLLQLLLWSDYDKKTYARPSTYSVLRGKIYEMIQGMVKMDPRERSTIQQCVDQHAQIKKLYTCLKRKTTDVKASPTTLRVRPNTKLNLCLAKQ